MVAPSASAVCSALLLCCGLPPPRVFGLEGTLANAADDGPVVECRECSCLVTLRQEHRLTTLAPRLKIIRFGAVLDKANGPCGLNHMAANHRSHSLAV